MKVFVFDLDKCNGCHNCQIACKDEHVDNDWSPMRRPQPDTGQFWCKVDEEVCGKTPHVRVNYLPRLCNHCDEAPCMKAFRPGGVQARRRPGDHRPRKGAGRGRARGVLPVRRHLLERGAGASPRNAPAAPIFSTTAGRSRAAWTRAARGPCGSARKRSSPEELSMRRGALSRMGHGAARLLPATSRSASLPRRWSTKRPTRWSRAPRSTLQRAEDDATVATASHRRVRRRVAGRPRARPVPDVGAEGGLP